MIKSITTLPKFPASKEINWAGDVAQSNASLHIRMSNAISNIKEIQELEYITEIDKKKLTELKKQLKTDKIKMKKRLKTWDDGELYRQEAQNLIKRTK